MLLKELQVIEKHGGVERSNSDNRSLEVARRRKKYAHVREEAGIDKHRALDDQTPEPPSVRTARSVSKKNLGTS